MVNDVLNHSSRLKLFSYIILCPLILTWLSLRDIGIGNNKKYIKEEIYINLYCIAIQ